MTEPMRDFPRKVIRELAWLRDQVERGSSERDFPQETDEEAREFCNNDSCVFCSPKDAR